MSTTDCSKLCLRLSHLLNRRTINQPLSRINNKGVPDFRLLLQMNIKHSIGHFCIARVFHDTDPTCGEAIHLPPYVPIYARHIGLNEAKPADWNDFLFLGTHSFRDDFRFIRIHQQLRRHFKLETIPSFTHGQMHQTSRDRTSPLQHRILHPAQPSTRPAQTLKRIAVEKTRICR